MHIIKTSFGQIDILILRQCMHIALQNNNKIKKQHSDFPKILEHLIFYSLSYMFH